MIMYDVKNLCEGIHGNPTCCCGQEGREGGGKSTLKTAYNFWTDSDEIYIYIYVSSVKKKKKKKKGLFANSGKTMVLRIILALFTVDTRHKGTKLGWVL